ncbi:amidohydrolase [Gilvimarinus xylanilyticus]|uniref:Omega-amidase YafV n=1 Tax=Gilvimarinus xylanilyticus TaxID=2944139 RepID=A0A9X2KSJ0_9GAMM|nr:amidohydrolase [Gilvimarinus xylanilyticus]MCP8898871.1 amidohydrolase [Gilvimarinus xylanilyticus]
MNDLTVTLLQSDITSDDPDANLRQLDAMLAQAGEFDLAVLPEVFTTGFHPRARQHAEVMGGRACQWLERQSANHSAAVTGSVVMEQGGGHYNRMLWAEPVSDPDTALDYYDKRHLFRMAGEHERYREGTRRVVKNYRQWRFLLQVCYDLRFPVFSRNQGDYDVIIYVANWPEARHDHWVSLLKSRAIENLSYVIGVNRAGVDAYDQAYAGGSQVIAPTGEVVAELGRESGTLKAVLNAKLLQAYRERFPAHLDADRFSLQD